MLNKKRVAKRDIQDLYALTPIQEGMLFHYLHNPQGVEYCEQLSLELQGHLNLELFEKSWDWVVENNEVLRTVFRWDEIERPIQMVLKSHTLQLQFVDLISSPDGKEEIEQIKKDDLGEGFDLEDVSFRLTLCQIDAERYVLIISYHHILFDGWSTGIILQEFLKTYVDLCQGRRLTRIKKGKFKDYVKWLQDRDRKSEANYWTDYFVDYDNNPELPIKRTDRSKETKVQRYKIILAEEMIRELSELLVEYKITLASFFYTVWGLLLQRYQNSSDVVFGTTVAGRGHKLPGIEETVGLFINTLPLRFSSCSETKLIDLLLGTHRSMVERVEYEATPLVDIKRFSGINPGEELFETLVVVENYPLDKLLIQTNGELQIVDYSIFEWVNYDLTISITALEQVEVTFIYNQKLFAEETIAGLGEHFRNLSWKLVNNVDQPVVEFEFLTEDERFRILHEFNNTRDEYSENSTIQQLFEQQVERTPDRAAVVCGDQQLTYRDLNCKSNQLAHYLREHGVTPGIIAAIMVERSLEMMIGILGILKAGGAYLPVSPKEPLERLSYILTDSQAAILLVDQGLTLGDQVCCKEKGDRISNQGWSSAVSREMTSSRIIVLNLEQFSAEKTSNPSHVNSSNDLVYVIYTSGSTGRPKGVLLEHRAVLNTLSWMQRKFALTEDDVLLQITAFTFDVSVWELFWWSLVGAQLVMLPPGGERVPQEIIDAVYHYGVTNIHLIASMLNIFLDSIKGEDLIKLKSLRKIFSSGEAVKPGHVEKFQSVLQSQLPDLQLWDLYGPTEAAIYASYFDCSTGDKLTTVPIGKPIQNTSLYILSNSGLLQPIGLPGELCIAGKGLARGYLNRPQLTAERFVDNPFHSGERMYRTGDVARWLTDGNVEFLGRLDDQVKIRGFRIELGEIENQLLRMAEIKEVVVRSWLDVLDESYLAAYIVYHRQITDVELRRRLAEQLPEYMIPGHFIEMEELPVTTNGKIERKSLPEPRGAAAQMTEYIHPRTELEAAVAEIWAEILGVEQVGINDNFVQLGGHSLKAIRLASKLKKEFGIQITLQEIFEQGTVVAIVKLIEQDRNKTVDTISPVSEREYYPTLAAQRRLFVLNQLADLDVSYNMSVIFEIQGQLHLSRLEEVLIRLIQRHEILRTSFELISEEVVQRVHPTVEFSLERYAEEDIQQIIKKFIRPFDLNIAPLLRVGLANTEDGKQYLLFDMHHIISDGVSVGILMKEFLQLYQGELLPNLPIHYRDYAVWQAEEVSDDLSSAEEFWIEQFADEIPVLDLPRDFVFRVTQSFQGDLLVYTLPAELSADLKQFVNESKITLYMLLLAVYYILLARYSRQEDIVIGTPTAGRPYVELDGIIGMFVNTLALRCRPEGDKLFVDFLLEIKEYVLKALENQNYGFEKLVEKIGVKKTDFAKNPLFDVMFVLENMDLPELDLPDLTFKEYNYKSGTAKFDLTLLVEEINDQLVLSMEYRTDLYKQDTIWRMLRHYENILRGILQNPQIALGQISLITQEEYRAIVDTFNDTRVEYPQKETLSALFEEQVQKSPNRAAVISKEENLTYGEVNVRANQLAHLLRGKGVTAGTVVGIMVDRSLEMMVGLYGILKAGGAYLPLSPDWSVQRIKYMLDDCGVTLLLTTQKLRKRVGETLDTARTIIALDTNEQILAAQKITNPDPVNSSRDLAYVIYTSGSTGRPKGVLIEHRSVLNTLYWMQREYPITPEDILLQITTFTFDVSVWELFWWSIIGARVIMLNPGGERDPEQILQTVDEYQVTQIHLIALMLNVFLDYLRSENSVVRVASLRRIITSGEAVSVSHVEKFDAVLGSVYPGLQLIDIYGPTEATIYASYFDCAAYREYPSIPIGKPIDNTRLFILGPEDQLQPIGIPGELCISGVGLARGYLNLPQLTAEKFVNNPYLPGEKMYRTGDLVRWLADGNIEYLGRIDFQVKVRGYRIELGEIENQLLHLPLIKEAVVVARDDETAGKYLVAYLIAAKEVSSIVLQESLSQELPDYMIPTYFVQLDQLPLTASGKLDRRNLPLPKKTVDTGSAYISPRNELEEKITLIWREVLGLEQLGVRDKFQQLGGHSLKGIQLNARLKQEFGVEIALKELFNQGTVEKIAKLIQSVEKKEYLPIKPWPKQNYYALSSAQRRLFILENIGGAHIVYNLPGVLQIAGNLNPVILEQAFQKIVNRHESLRTSFELVIGEPVQKVNEVVDFRIEYLDTSNCTIPEVIDAFIRPFDLKEAPLLRIGLAILDKENYLLLFDMHHIISDMISIQIMIQEFVTYYTGGELPEIQIQYKDFAAWQNQFFQSKNYKAQERYWLSKFKGQIPQLNLSLDYSRPTVQNYVGTSQGFQLSVELSESLADLAQSLESTLFMVLLAVYNILLMKYTRQEDIIIGTPIAGRWHPDTQKIIGMFVNTLALRNYPKGEKRFSEFLAEVRIHALDAYANQDYQFEELVWKLGLTRDSSRNPLFDVMFVAREKELTEDLPDLKIRPFDFEYKVAHFDLLLEFSVIKGRINLVWEYATSLFGRSTIEKMHQRYAEILQQIVEDPGMLIKDIGFTHQLLEAKSNILEEDVGDFDF